MVAKPLRTIAPLRILTVGTIGDGCDRAANTITVELARRGIDVISLGERPSAEMIVRAAIQEDVNAIGISACNEGHLVFFREVCRQLKRLGSGDIPLFVYGGAPLTKADERVRRCQGTARIFSAGTPFDEIVTFIKSEYARPAKPHRALKGDRSLARAITLAEITTGRRAIRPSGRAVKPHPATHPFILGVCGPGGAGKSMLIAALTTRFLQRVPRSRIAILANDPSHPESHGAILGDCVSPVYMQNDRVFFRSFASRGSLSGLSSAVPAAIDILRRTGDFDLLIIESAGGGPPSDPFAIYGRKPPLADAVLFVLDPHYGGSTQLQKIALLNGADLVALNKCDLPAAAAARTKMQALLARNGPARSLHGTSATSHFDPGTDGLFEAVAELADLVTNTGGEKPCMMRVMG